jgi:hypothetical protein
MREGDWKGERSRERDDRSRQLMVIGSAPSLLSGVFKRPRVGQEFVNFLEFGI